MPSTACRPWSPGTSQHHGSSFHLHHSFYLPPAISAPAWATAITLQPPHTRCVLVRTCTCVCVCVKAREKDRQVCVCGSAGGSFCFVQHPLIKVGQRDTESESEWEEEWASKVLIHPSYFFLITQSTSPFKSGFIHRKLLPRPTFWHLVQYIPEIS